MIKKVINNIKTADTLEKSMFWIVGIIGFLATLIVAILCIAFGLPILTFIVHLASALGFAVVLFLCSRGDNYKIYYAIIAIFFAGLVVPFSNFSFHGKYAWEPLISIVVLLTCQFIAQTAIRRSAIALCVFTNVLSFYLIKKCFYDECTALTMEIIIAFIVAGIVVFVFSDFTMRIFSEYALSKQILNQYMDYNVQKEIYKGKSVNDYLNIMSSRNATVMFVDINSFTSTSEALEPELVAEYLNIFLNIADRCIHENGGTLDKYIGDCAMAFWLDEKKEGYGVYECCKTLMDMRREIADIQESIYERFGVELDFSAGINYGNVIVGGVGSERRKDYTVIGNTVNVAQRIQSFATRGVICVSKTVYDIMGQRGEFELVSDNMMLKGKTKGQIVYELKTVYDNSRVDNRQLVEDNTKDEGSKWVLYICGSRGSYSVTGSVFSEFGGETSCYIIKYENYAMVIDCGTGLYKARDILADCEKIDVLLTHVHYDHILGLLDWSVFPQSAVLTLYGNFKEWEGQDTIHNFLRAPFWPIDLSSGRIISIKEGIAFNLGLGVSATFYEASHPNGACFVVLKRGQRKICILADCEDPDILPSGIVHGSDVVIFDGMYEDKDYPKHIGWGHSTWQRGVKLAVDEKVEKLIITHHNPLYSDRRLKALELRAQEMFPETTFARAGDRYTL